MLDLESLFASPAASVAVPTPAPANPAESLDPCGIEPDQKGADGGEVGHSGHNGNAPAFAQVCPRKSLQHKSFNGLGTVGTVGTVAFQGGEGQASAVAPGGGAARERFALNPSAVVLAVAYCRKVKACNDETASVLLHLESMPPDEQIRRWYDSCLEVGVKPWEALTRPAPLSGNDCTMCKHLTTRQLASDGGRRQFHWACGLGYLILETGRETERIWIAPPECKRFERWRPAAKVD